MDDGDVKLVDDEEENEQDDDKVNLVGDEEEDEQDDIVKIE